MKPASKTLALAALALVLGLLNLLDRGTGQRVADELPRLPALEREQVQRIEISTALEKVVLERESGGGDKALDGGEGRWRLRAPSEGEADQVGVRTLLNQFRKETPIDVRVDQGELEKYGLDAGAGIVVELFAGDREPALSFTVGNDAPGGSSFVRLSGSEAIYRARVGGRQRYQRSAAEWRNRVLLDYAVEDFDALTVNQGDQTTLHLTREASTDAAGKATQRYSLEPAPPWAVDQDLAQQLVAGLGRVRGGESLGATFDGGFSPPRATIQVRLQDGAERSLEVGSREVDGAAFVRARGEVWRVARSAFSPLLGSADLLRDKTLFAFSRTEVDTIALRDDSGSVMLQQDLATGLWRVVDPPNMDIDVRLVFQAVQAISALRAEAVAEQVPAQAGLEPAPQRVIVQFLDGRGTSLDIGGAATLPDGKAARYVRTEGKSQVYLLGQDSVDRILQGFGRGQPRR
jgi:Domain of unknown function (DUF4340)